MVLGVYAAVAVAAVVMFNMTDHKHNVRAGSFAVHSNEAPLGD